MTKFLFGNVDQDDESISNFFYLHLCYFGKAKPMNILSPDFSGHLTVQKLEILRNHKIITSLDFVQTNNDKILA